MNIFLTYLVAWQSSFIILVLVTGAKLSVRPSKVVAGLEAEKTNEFLQTLAVAIEKKVSCFTFPALTR